MAKSKYRSPKFTPYLKKDYEAVAWCHKNRITMHVVPGYMVDRSGDYYVEIKIKDKVFYSPPYTKDDVSLKQKEFYHYYKNKYENN
jgi:hypothetical protein